MLPALPTVLILQTLHLTMPGLLLATLGADWWGPVQGIKQHNLIEEGHLPQFLDIFADLYLNLYFNLGRLMVGAACLLFLPVTTYGACLSLLLWALLCLVSLLPAAETLDLVWMAIHKDWHFYWSMDAWDEWRWFGVCVYRGREGLL